MRDEPNVVKSGSRTSGRSRGRMSTAICCVAGFASPAELFLGRHRVVHPKGLQATDALRDQEVHFELSQIRLKDYCRPDSRPLAVRPGFGEKPFDEPSRDLGIVCIRRCARRLGKVIAVPAGQHEQARIGKQPRQLDRVFEPSDVPIAGNDQRRCAHTANRRVRHILKHAMRAASLSCMVFNSADQG